MPAASRLLSAVATILFLLVGTAHASDASGVLRIPENKLQFQLYPQPVLIFVAVNSSKHAIEGNFSFELINVVQKDQKYSDAVFASAKGTLKEEPGENIERIPWTADRLPSTDVADLALYRLRYSFTPNADLGFAPVSGILQFGNLFTNRFNLTMSAAGKTVPGAKHPVRVRVENPETGKPMAGIPVALQFELSDCDRDPDEIEIKRGAVTGPDGYAIETFQIPMGTTCGEGDVEATATRGIFSDSVSTRFKLPQGSEVRLSTDKPLYQPGQTIHMRVVAFGPNKHALSGRKLRLTIGDDESNDSPFERTITTSPFGIASADWNIPNKLKLGDYQIKAQLLSADANASSQEEMQARIRISRYDLPTFTVKVKPDTHYYLIGQNAKVEISADYLFGKPVQQAKVRVVRQENSEWDSKTGKWIGDESNPVLGQFDANNKFIANVDLQPESQAEEGSSPRWQDVDLAAYVTDLSTDITEQRRFTLRVAWQPIHLYVASSTYEPNGEPRDVYITSSHPDGTPALVNGKLAVNGDGAPVVQFHTNEFGLARVRLPHVSEDFVTVGNANCYRGQTHREIPITIEAEDTKGLRGKYGSELSVQNPQADFVEVRTDRTLYRPGEAVNVTVSASMKEGEFVVDAVSIKGTLFSRVIDLVNGEGHITVPYDTRFRGMVKFQVYSLKATGSPAEGTAAVIYANPEELKVSVTLPRATFLPGETVSTGVTVKTPEGNGAQSALGLVVFDEAVSERLRTDQDFGDYGFSSYDYFNYSRYGEIAGHTLRDLLVLNSKQPFSESVQLLAETLLLTSSQVQNDDTGSVDVMSQSGYGWNGTLKDMMQQQLAPAQAVLDQYDKHNLVYPPEPEFRSTLIAAGIDFDELRDSWGVPYRVSYSNEMTQSTIIVSSNGPDKLPNTGDDVELEKFTWPYFLPIGNNIAQSTTDYLNRTGEYIRDYATLRDEVKQHGIDLDSLRDPWGYPYQFTFQVQGAYYGTTVLSGGPDGKLTGEPWCHDIVETSSSIHYFQREYAALLRSLAEHYSRTGIFPHNEEELKPVLAAAHLRKEQLTDPWGHPYEFKFSTRAQYGNRTDIESFSDYSSEPIVKAQITPVTQQVAHISIWSEGPVPHQGFEVDGFSRVLSEQSSKDVSAVPTPVRAPLGVGEGAISGTVTDPSDKAIAKATVVATSDDEKQYKTGTDEQGNYALSLPAGFYRIEITGEGFQERFVLKVPVQASQMTKLSTKLIYDSAALRALVMNRRGLTLNTEAATVSSTAEMVMVEKKRRAASENEAVFFTPRVRKNFTETLLWRPEVITDAGGNAHISFPMADNITSWKMSVMASTQDGQIGVADKELHSFQPFFIEHNPPKMLTQGDEISLPVVLRNYSANPLKLEAEMKAAPWFSFISQPRQQVSVSPNGNASVVFAFRADSATRSGTQRVVARNSVAGDAVEQQVTVHPNGQEITTTTAKILAGTDDHLDIEIPKTAISGSADVELMLYPSLIAHVLEAMNGIGQRPGGCMEQVTSIAYVNLLGLKLLKKQGMIDGSAQADLVLKAELAVEEGYDEIVAAQHTDGGFGYLDKFPSNVALTAYVLRFLAAAGNELQVDPAVVTNARNYLLSQQKKSGAWTKMTWPEGRELEDAYTTSEVARSLALTMPGPKDADREQLEASLNSAMTNLDLQAWPDAYVAGNYAIAAIATGNKQRIKKACESLAQLAHPQGSATYWSLEANMSPFYGWGDPGRVESTAIAVEALAMLPADDDSTIKEQMERGVHFLLSHKDPYRVWYSTHASQAAVEALAAAIPAGNNQGGASKADVVVNGHKAVSVDLPAAKDIVGAIAVDVDKHLVTGRNSIQVLRPENGTPMNTQAVTSYYVSWSNSSATHGENVQRGDTRALRLNVHYSQTEPKVDEPVTCDIKVERIGFEGYGMMIAEIGLPPGADVDRQSLQDFGPRYEVHPDRIVFYLWPAAGGTKLSFNFRTRYRMNANTSPSTLYDYYNPEANATVAPVEFDVH